jgi:CrcB protein
MILVCIAVGGALGALARYAVGGWVYSWAGAELPWDTALINVSGSFLIGFILQYLSATSAAPEWRAFLAIGFLGAYTTFSTFSYETIALVRSGEWQRALLYVFGSVVLSLAATVAGLFAAAALLHRRG